MAAPEWQGTTNNNTGSAHAGRLVTSPASTVHASTVPAGTVPSGIPVGATPALLTGVAADLVGLCGGFFDPAVLAQLDAALAHELAARARNRSTEAASLLEAAVREGQSSAYLAQLAHHASSSRAAATKALALARAATDVATALSGTSLSTTALSGTSLSTTNPCVGAPDLTMPLVGVPDGIRPGGTESAGSAVEVAGFNADVVDGVDGAALIELIRQLEQTKNALTGVQVQAEALFTAQQRLAQARADVPKEELGKGVALQIGLARHESPHRGRQLTELAAVLVRELPHTMNAITGGVIGEYRAQIIATETVFLTAEHRCDVDRIISADPSKLAAMGQRELAAAARRAAYLLEPEVFVKRREKAVTERHVSLRPAADGMTLLTALIPLRHGVAILNTLTKTAQSAMAAGDERGKGQLMADALMHRLINHSACDIGAGTPGDHRGPIPAAESTATSGPPSGARAGELCTTVTEPDIALELIMTDRALFEGGNDPAILVGHEPIPAPEARTMIFGNGNPQRVWIKRLFTHPDSNELMAMDSRARLFPEGMKEFLRLQYQRCATPYCDAPIRQYDHIKSWAAGGETRIGNGQGLCTACNQDKETPGWTSEPFSGDAGPRSIRITTPTGHDYIATAPPLPGDHTRRRRPRRC